jgi:hypothetical protein
MSGIESTTAPVSAVGSTESGSGEGQSTEPETTQGQSVNNAQDAAGEPTGEGSVAEKKPEAVDYESQYKELQTEFGKRNETLKELQYKFD